MAPYVSASDYLMRLQLKHTCIWIGKGSDCFISLLSSCVPLLQVDMDSINYNISCFGVKYSWHIGTREMFVIEPKLGIYNWEGIIVTLYRKPGKLKYTYPAATDFPTSSTPGAGVEEVSLVYPAPLCKRGCRCRRGCRCIRQRVPG